MGAGVTRLKSIYYTFADILGGRVQLLAENLDRKFLAISIPTIFSAGYLHLIYQSAPPTIELLTRAEAMSATASGGLWLDNAFHEGLVQIQPVPTNPISFIWVPQNIFSSARVIVIHA